MPYRAMSFKRGGAWTKVVIFISLYVLMLESLMEWVAVLYLYGNKHVDPKMAPSLIFALVASFFTVPLVILHSFLAWQYNRVLGYASQKAVLHIVCTYILRLTTIIWLGASVAGLVVVSQQAYCLPDAAGGSFWQVGVSCALHRAVVIISVLSFLTACLYFCSRELCERPYDVWLLGVYNHKRSSRDGSILSASTLNSEKSLKRDILCVCRHPDLTYGPTPYTTTRNNSEKSGTAPSIQQPAPIHPTSFLAFSLVPDAEAEYLSGTTVTPGTQSDFFQSDVSRTPSTITAQTSFQAPNEALPELPGATLQRPSNHTRNQASTSSLRRFLPKSLPFSISLSSDPQIRALSEASTQVDLEKQQSQKDEPRPEEPKPPATLAKSPQPPPKDEQPLVTTQDAEARTSLPRSTTMNSADAPEVITPAPLNIHRSNTTQTAPPPVTANAPRTLDSRTNLLSPAQANPLRMNTMHVPQRQTQGLSQVSFPQGHVPRYTQSQRFPRPGDRNPYSRHLRRNETEIIRHYRQPGLRRPRSSTFGNVSIKSIPGRLDSIRETGASIDELPAGDGRPARTQCY
ncbi:uncharacterized protein BDV17DRAFT_301597 [Aspergillus undulatus]|uniref:uncharacterized protein n=1 Tax=Aspergillus undulatus TaxID=1810928 RepID=UPI003CCCA111